MPSIEQLLAQAEQQLAGLHESARLDAEVLLAHVLGKERSYLRAWPERELSAGELAAYESLVARRAAGEPVAHLTGRREFWSLPLYVNADTLIPRPETELLVEQALARIPADASLTIADLGTGSGAIALALASERPACRIVATDHSTAALEIARTNARRLGLPNVEFRQGDWLAPLAGERHDLIVSNPPYIPETDPHLQRGDVRFEPTVALAAGADGLDAIRCIVANTPAHLRPGGWLLLEHGYDQGPQVLSLLTKRGFQSVAGYRDAQGHTRVTIGCWH